MFEGTLVAIYTAPAPKVPVVLVPRVRAVVGRGLEGDRNFAPETPMTPPHRPEDEVTLVEEEAVAAVARESKLPFSPAETRRNLVTRGVALNHLVGREFTVGPVRLRGIRLCEPCATLESMTRPGIVKDLLHRAGLRAEILVGGVIETGHPIRAAGSA